MLYPGTRKGIEAAMIAKAIIQQKTLSRLAAKVQDGTLGSPGGPSGDVSVQVGDTVTNVHPSSKTLGTLAKLAIAAALLGTGGGLAVGLSELLKPPPAIEIPPDADTRYELHLGIGP